MEYGSTPYYVGLALKNMDAVHWDKHITEVSIRYVPILYKT